MKLHNSYIFLESVKKEEKKEKISENVIRIDMPNAAFLVGHSGAVARSGEKTAWLIGEGIVFGKAAFTS